MNHLSTISELASDFSNKTIKVYSENGNIANPTKEMLDRIGELARENKTVYTILQNNNGIYYPYYSEHYNVYPEEVREGFLKSYGYFEGIFGNDESTMIIGKLNGIIKNISLQEQMNLN